MRPRLEVRSGVMGVVDVGVGGVEGEVEVGIIGTVAEVGMEGVMEVARGAGMVGTAALRMVRALRLMAMVEAIVGGTEVVVMVEALVDRGGEGPPTSSSYCNSDRLRNQTIMLLSTNFPPLWPPTCTLCFPRLFSLIDGMAMFPLFAMRC
jgi:hypothetical protein